MSVTEDTLMREFPVKTAWSGTVSKWMGLFVILGLGLVPIYKFASGGFQIADPFIVVLILMAFFVKGVNEHIKKHVYLLIPFIVWAILVNSGYYLVYQIPGNLRAIITNMYDFFILWCFTIIFFEILKKKGLIYIYLGLILALIAIFTIPGFRESESPRLSYSFNNPNQLALYSLALYAMVLLLMQYRIDYDIKNNIYIIFDVIIIVTIQYLLWQSVSRSGLIASLFLHIALIRKIFSRKLFVPVSLAVSLPIIYVLFLNPSYIEERIAVRNPARIAPGAVESRVKGAILGPMENLTGLKILFGTGAVFVDEPKHPVEIRAGEFKSEVHNMLAHTLWAYGIIGFLLFLAWIAKSIWESRILTDGILIWGAILAFSFGGVVIRFRSYWILLGLLLALVGLKLLKQEKPITPVPGDGLRRQH